MMNVVYVEVMVLPVVKIRVTVKHLTVMVLELVIV